MTLLPFRIALAATAGALLTLASCSSPGAQNTYVGTEGDAEVQEITGDSGLARDLEIVNLRSQRRSDRLFIQFDLQNRTKSALAFEWSIQWFDDAGFRLDFPDNWTPMVIGGAGMQTITRTGPTTNATSWRLGVRSPDPVR